MNFGKTEITYKNNIGKTDKRVKIILENPWKVCFDMFYRKIEKRLYEYYNNVDAKLVVINGARQIGKSFIIRETAKKHFVKWQTYCNKLII